jgi:hypothetical protein
MMNEQRILVGTQGLAQGSTAYLHGLKFSRERLQGPEFGSKNHDQVPIIKHPDIRRHLMWMKASTEGMRALILFAVYCLDQVAISQDDQERKKWRDFVEVLTPVCKAYCTEKGFDVCTESIQVHGGYGYCKEYMVEQFARDSKIATLFEGTNGIQALDLLGRKVRMRGGEAFRNLMTKMKETIRSLPEISELTDYTADVVQAVSALEDLTAFMLERTSAEEAYLSYSWASAYLDIFGDITLAWLFLWQAAVAHEQVEQNSSEAAFYESKMSTARFYIGSFLPVTHGKVAAIKQADKAFLEMGEALFSE